MGTTSEAALENNRRFLLWIRDFWIEQTIPTMRVQLNRGAFHELAHTRHLPSVSGTKILLAPALPGELLSKRIATPVLLYHHPKEHSSTWGMHNKHQQKQDCGYLKYHRQFQIQCFVVYQQNAIQVKKSILDESTDF